MLAKQTTRYTLAPKTASEMDEAINFINGIEAFYGWGGAEVRVIEEGDLVIVEYNHIIETKDTVFGGK